MKLGAHVSIGRGFAAAAAEAVALGCEAMQVFSRSPRGGKAKPIAEEDVSLMKGSLESAGIRPLAVHVPYYVNLCSPDPRTYEYSVQVLLEDVERAAALGASFLVVHPGHGDAGESSGLQRLATALRRACLSAAGGERILIENTSGQGHEVGADLDEVARILEMVGVPDRTGVCIDTCHALAWGYDLGSDRAVSEFVREIDRAVGLHRVFLVHLNDSKWAMGSRRDRHEHIGRGAIGLAGFKAIVNHEAFRGLPGVIETPVEDDRSNAANLEVLRGLRSS
ncbi:MAG: deoxyribonuclease IV [Firmicutes bacterium]|nr:deoxyribonuclease IV [Bacillota bacterium]